MATHLASDGDGDNYQTISFSLSSPEILSNLFYLTSQEEMCHKSKGGGEAPFLNQILGLMSRAKRGVANHRAAAAKKKSPRNHLGRNFREPFFLGGAGSSSAVKAPPLQHSWDDSGHFAAAAAVEKGEGISPRGPKNLPA